MGVPARFELLPPNLPPENLLEQLLPQTDLFGAHHDETWRDEELAL
jgi:hypothetical protein